MRGRANHRQPTHPSELLVSLSLLRALTKDSPQCCVPKQHRKLCHLGLEIRWLHTPDYQQPWSQWTENRDIMHYRSEALSYPKWTDPSFKNYDRQAGWLRYRRHMQSHGTLSSKTILLVKAVLSGAILVSRGHLLVSGDLPLKKYIFLN